MERGGTRRSEVGKIGMIGVTSGPIPSELTLQYVRKAHQLSTSGQSELTNEEWSPSVILMGNKKASWTTRPQQKFKAYRTKVGEN